MKAKEICGTEKVINYDKKIKKLNLMLAKDEFGCPIIIFQDWTGVDSKDLFRLHIKEAIELKSDIDMLVINYLEDKDKNFKEK